ncbi:MAG: M13 family metallopeptidase [Bdellovibrio sp.]|nr:M13 family metallopeptidase [Bdellovibrio sp.]
MKKIILVILSVYSFCFAAEPTSDIPAKRNFPLSIKFKPCDDFHKYVCDEAESAFKLRDDRSRHIFSFGDSNERILDAKKHFFTNIQKEKNLSPRATQLKDFYLACMNESVGKIQEQQYIQKLGQEIAALKTTESFLAYQFANIEKGQPSFFYFGVNANQDKPEVNDLILLSNLMNLPEHSYYENRELMADYKVLIMDFFKIVDPQLSEKDLSKKADRLISFEKDFVKVYPYPVVQRQRWSEKRQQTQTDFIKKYPKLPFSQILSKIPASALVFNAIPESFEFLNQKVTGDYTGDYTGDHLDVLKDMFYYSVASGLLDDSNPEYFNKQFVFKNKYLGGPVSRSHRNERCTRGVMDSFTKELDQILIKRLFPNFPEKKFQAVADNIRASIIKGLKNNVWLESATKEKAILKMEKAKLFLVKPNNEKEWDFVSIKKYSDKYKIDNNILVSKNHYEKRMADLKTGVNLVGWGMGPLTANAYYDSSANKFVMPMGILQYPFFNAQGDLIENLGAVGAVIGHELGHGIDDEGSKYDEIGRLNQWMSMKDLKEFSNRGRRLIEQFNKAGFNGGFTLGENIGDLVGLTFAYQAAFPEGKGSIEDQKKLFIAYGRVWCGVTRPKMAEQLLKTDPHAAGWARINEQVKHQKPFAEAFQCKAGDKMFLPDSERIQIW